MSNSIDQQFIEFVVKSLVSKPDEVSIARRIDEKGVLLELTVDPEDLGRVIGKRGGTAQSIRTLLRALGTKNDARYNLKIIDNGPPQEDRPRREENNNRLERRDEQAATPAEKPAAAPASVEDAWTSSNEEAKPDEPVAATETENRDDALAKTRAELADLDDLDV